MPSIHRQPGRPFWFCAFTLFNPEIHTSTRVFRSTKTRDKKQALEICRTWHKAALKARNGKLSADAAREVITRGVSDVYAAANLESLESATVRKWCEKWLETKSIEAEESTHARYKRIVDRFLECIGAKANRDLSTLQANDIARFRDREAKALSRTTANLSLKVLRVCFGEAVRRGLGAVNPAARVPVLKSRDKSTRRAFTLSEIKRILKACGDDAEWRGLVLFGLYLGQRLGAPHMARSESRKRRDLRSPLARPAGESCCRSCNRSLITWHRCQSAFLRLLAIISQYFTRVCSVRSMRESCFLMEILSERHTIV